MVMWFSQTQSNLKLTKGQRSVILDRTCRTVQQKYFDPRFNGKDWAGLAELARDKIVETQDPEEFEILMHRLVCELGTSHTGFFHRNLRRVPGRLAIGATFRPHQISDGLRWMFQDVHEGGPAHASGITPVDLLLEINQQAVNPPELPRFPMGEVSSVAIQKPSGRRLAASVHVPRPRWRQQPYAEPRTVSFAQLDDRIGYMKTTIAPGVLGVDVGREIDVAVTALGNCERLILDMRGYLGGGLGVLRLMSYLTSDKLPIGYSVTRWRAERRYNKEELPRFDYLPRSKLGIPIVALRYIGRDESVTLVTEGLRRQRFHGRIVVLVNEHTASAGEMVCAFAVENKLATVVGSTTAGRLLGGKGFGVGHGYLVVLPAAAFFTWQGKSFEGQGITPDVLVDWSPEAVQEGRDSQLEKAIEVVKSL